MALSFQLLAVGREGPALAVDLRFSAHLATVETPNPPNNAQPGRHPPLVPGLEIWQTAADTLRGAGMTVPLAELEKALEQAAAQSLAVLLGDDPLRGRERRSEGRRDVGYQLRLSGDRQHHRRGLGRRGRRAQD